MLNREMLKFRRRDGDIRPLLIKPDDPKRRAPAESLLALYNCALQNHWTRGELDDYLEPLLKGAADSKFAAGLNKLLADRTAFQAADSGDFRERRRKLFHDSMAAFVAADGDYRRFREELPEAFVRDIYGDLPEYETVISFRNLSPDELLNRYNLALVQGLLIYTAELEIRVHESEPAELRRLFKYLKFFRLLAEFWKEADDPDTVHLSVSGPFSIFENTRRYGIALASFFPALVRMKEWQLEAVVKSGNKPMGKLRLSNADRLISHYRNFSAFIPEEIRLFHRLFVEKSPGWTPVGETPFIDGGNQRLVFPDFSFRCDADGRVVHLELFHRWHRGQLEERLNLLDHHPELQLVIGIDRAIASDDELAVMLQKHPGAGHRIMRFRDFPGVANTVKLLNDFTAENQ